MDPIKVLIADDHEIIREGLKTLLKRSHKISIVAAVENGQAALNQLEKEPIDLILMDVSMPIVNGIEATKIIAKEYPEIPVLALSVHDDKRHIISMLKSGARGYILKSSDKEVLEEAIKQVYKGETYFPKDVTTAILESYMKKKKPQKKSGIIDPQLTKRECEILKLVAEGNSNIEIAKALYLSPRTIDSHRRNLLQKLNAKNTAGLVRYAFRNQIVE